MSDPAITKLINLDTAELFISIFSLSELRAGAELSAKLKTELAQVEKMLKFISVLYPDSTFPVFYGETEAALRKEGTPIPEMDLLIGITAKAAGIAILTKDTDHY